MRSKTVLSILLMNIIVSGAIVAAPHPADDYPASRSLQRKNVSFEEMKSSFKQPDLIYAPFAFWFFDHALDPEHAARMAAQMCRQGMNPGYAHPRRGLPREEWLSPFMVRDLRCRLAGGRSAGRLPRILR